MTSAEAAPPPGVLRRLEGPAFPGALRAIADFVLADPAAAARMTIVELAERTGTSPGTITRFSRACGLTGYADLRVAIAEEAARTTANRWASDIGHEIHPDDPLDRVLQVLVSANSTALFSTADRLDPRVVDAVCAALIGARHCHFFGVGTSAITAEELAIRLRRIEIPCWVWPDAHSALIAVAQSDERDVVVGISFSGRVTETVEVISAAAARGATTIVITRDGGSPLAEHADLLLTTAASTGDQSAQSMADRHAQFLLVDVIYARIAQLTHPGIVDVLERTADALQTHRLPPRPSRRPPRPGPTRTQQ